MAELSTKLPFPLMITRWASQLNPVLANPLLQGNEIIGVSLQIGDNVINTGLSRQQKGWVITDLTGNSSIYRNAPFNDKTLTLNSSAVTTINLLVY